MIFIFWLCIAAVFYAYFGYPLILWLIARFISNKQALPHTTKLPSVSLIISAYNEEDVIEEKILNSLSLDYPKELLEIIVVSDGSTDHTNEIAIKYSNEGVILQVYEGRIGKTACLNQAVPKCISDIIIFSDANSMYDESAVKQLVKHFQLPDVALVTGRTKYLSGSESAVTGSTGFYTKLETVTKRLESELGSCIGADGAIFAIRKEFYKPLSSYDINDLVIPLRILKSGYRAVIEENAFCYEKTAKDTKGEFSRQVRITNRTVRALFNHKQLLNPFKFPVISFEIISHKLLKLLTPFFLIIILISNLLMVTQGIFFAFTLVFQLLFYGTALLNHVSKNNSPNRLSSVISSFVVVSIAYLMGWIKYFAGETFSTWEPERKQD